MAEGVHDGCMPFLDRQSLDKGVASMLERCAANLTAVQKRGTSKESRRAEV